VVSRTCHWNQQVTTDIKLTIQRVIYLDVWHAFIYMLHASCLAALY